MKRSLKKCLEKEGCEAKKKQKKLVFLDFASLAVYCLFIKKPFCVQMSSQREINIKNGVKTSFQYRDEQYKKMSLFTTLFVWHEIA